MIEAFTDVVPPGSSMICIASTAAHSCPSLSPECYQYLARAPRERLLEHPEVDLTAASKLAYQVSKKGVEGSAHQHCQSGGDLDPNEYAEAGGTQRTYYPQVH